MFASALSILGCIYAIFILAVFLYNRNTSIVRSSNLTFSIFQIMFHIISNADLAIIILEQQYICYILSILGGYLLNIIMSIYIIKTNQLLAVFLASTKMKKNVCLTFKQAVFPATYITVNMFITVIFLTTYKKIEYDLFEQTDSLITYNYCDMETYFYIDIAFVIIVSCMLGASFDDRETTSKLQ